MTNLSDIIEKLEKAESGDRKLDLSIMNLLVPRAEDEKRYFMGKLLQAKWGAYGHMADQIDYYIEAPKVTSSVDAAISLASKITPNMDWLVRNDEAGAFVNLSSVRDGGEWIEGVNSFPTWAPTAPIAFCLAILKAKAQQQEGGE